MKTIWRAKSKADRWATRPSNHAAEQYGAELLSSLESGLVLYATARRIDLIEGPLRAAFEKAKRGELKLLPLTALIAPERRATDSDGGDASDCRA